MSYPVTYLVLTAEDAGTLHRWHASGDEAAVLARVRELVTSSVERLSIDREWEPIRRRLVGYHPVGGGQSVFGRRDYDVNLLDAAPGPLPAGSVTRAGVAARGCE